MGKIRNPFDYTKHLGDKLVRYFQERNFRVRGFWHEQTKEYSLLFPDNTDFTFWFDEDSFSVVINPSEEHTGALKKFLEVYVNGTESETNYERALPTVSGKKQFLKYSERLKLRDVKLNGKFCGLEYEITKKMPDSNESIGETIMDYVLRRAFLFVQFKKSAA